MDFGKENILKPILKCSTLCFHVFLISMMYFIEKFSFPSRENSKKTRYNYREIGIKFQWCILSWDWSRAFFDR